MADEENAVRGIALTLENLAGALRGFAPSDGVDIGEASEFLSMLITIINHQGSEDRLRTLIFEVQPSLVLSIIEIVQSTNPTARGDANYASLILNAIEALRLLTHHSLDPKGEEPSYVSQLTIHAVESRQAVGSVANLFVAGALPSIQSAAGELLFGLLLRSQASKQQLVQAGGVATLVQSLSDPQSHELRRYAAVCLREVANGQAASLLQYDAVHVLLRSISLDNSPDVRSLSAETLDVFVRMEPSAWASFQYKKELSAVVISRLESEENPEVLEAVLKMLETLLISDGNLGESMRQSSSFTEVLLTSFGDRFLVGTFYHGGRIASLAARDLRLLLQLAPYHRHASHHLCQHFPTLAKLLRTVVGAAQAPLPEEVVVRQILRVELAIALGIMMLQDPRCREAIRESKDNPEWGSALKNSLLQYLNAAALEYLSGITIVDASGQVINDPAAVTWELEHDRPSRQSVQDLIIGQEERWRGAAHPLQSTHKTRDGDMHMMKLTFILLSYIIHLTLSNEPMNAFRAGAEHMGMQTESGAMLTTINQRSLFDDNSTAFSKFDNSLKLCLNFAQFYQNVGAPEKVVFETDGTFARRQPKHQNWFAGPTPGAKSWTVTQLKEGDLFYFSIPITSLSTSSMTRVKKNASRHLQYIKDAFNVTPQSAKARRWFLYDMLNNVMPGTIALLSEFVDLFQEHGDENVKFPIVMFRNQSAGLGKLDQATLHPGNLAEVLQQVRFYFEQAEANQAATGDGMETSQYLHDVEKKIEALKSMKFTGNEKSLLEDIGSDVTDDDDYQNLLGDDEGY